MPLMQVGKLEVFLAKWQDLEKYKLIQSYYGDHLCDVYSLVVYPTKHNLLVVYLLMFVGFGK